MAEVGGLAPSQPSPSSAAPARPFDAVGEFLVSLGNIQELAAHIGVAHCLGLPPDDFRPLQVLLGAGFKRIETQRAFLPTLPRARRKANRLGKRLKGFRRASLNYYPPNGDAEQRERKPSIAALIYSLYTTILSPLKEIAK